MDWNIQTFPELPSTQLLAREKLQSGEAKHGDVFAALHQTEGRGRYPDRIWHDEFGANLLMSIVLTDIPKHLQDKMQFVVGLSILSTLRVQLSTRSRMAFDTARIRLKWPNDILIDDKKVSGVVCDAIWSANVLKGIIAGIGININQDFFPEEISAHAASLKQYVTDPIPVDRTRSLVLAMLQFSLEYYTAERLLSKLREEFEWMRSLGQFSLVEPDGIRHDGLHYERLSDEGALIVLAQSGDEKIFQNGSLQLT